MRSSFVVLYGPEVTRAGLCVLDPLAAGYSAEVAVSGQRLDVATQEARPSVLAALEAPPAGRTGCGLAAIQKAHPSAVASGAFRRVRTDYGLGAAAVLRSASTMLPRARRDSYLDAEIQKVPGLAPGSEAVLSTGQTDCGLGAAIQEVPPSASAASEAAGRTGCGPEAAEALPAPTASEAMLPGGSGSLVSE